jgi:addiction module HigA family antidote
MPKSPTPLRFPHPGEILQTEFLEPLGVTQYRLALDLKIPHSRVTAIILGRRAVTPDTALRLSRYFGTSAESPKPVVERAKSTLSRLELHSVKPEQKKQGPKAKNTVQDEFPKPAASQMDLFADF